MANPRFFGKNDLDTFDRVNKELIGDLNNANSGIIDQTVIVYKISANNTETNMYGESSSGKVYKPGIELACLVASDDMTYNTDFAQVEVDEQQVNLDRFNLFFPEKRAFFLENAGQFSVGSPGEVDLFFSRRIGLEICSFFSTI